jgi:hypothetical protein
MSTLRTLLALLLLSAPALAHAQDEEGDDTTDTRPAPKKKRHKNPDTAPTAEEELIDTDAQTPKLARMDDPRIGLGAELTLSLNLLDKSDGPGARGTGAAGVRVNWAPGVLWTDPEDEFWRYALLTELSYDYSGYSGGTSMVNTRTRLHYLNAHVMFGYPAQKVLLLYGLLGPGVTFEHVTYEVQGATTPLTGAKFNLAYGLGARLNLQVNDRVAIVSRIELMRFRRGYMDDTFLTFSAGMGF